ncbi:MAG TPA: dienelactone hydrolase family protein [Terriglobia bacterium]|nr:dienelactone hydrolase family protein [Terriglobia bacterium]
MKSKMLLVLSILLSATLARAQADSSDIKPILSERLQSAKVVTFQLQQFLMGTVPKLANPSGAKQWTADAARIRRHLLDDVIFHGWPQEWINSPPRFEDLGALPSGKGYQLRKLRYEIVPGFYGTALLYEPAHLSGKVPAVLNVMGHFDTLGNTVEFEQKFCINQALRGMIALNPDWLGMGELNQSGNEHWFAAHLDLVGMNGVGLFYLAMRKGLDYLAQDPNVDQRRIGMTGLSGGGWQTIVLSSLDPRVAVSVPVAGYTTLQGRLERLPGEPGDVEQNASDFLAGQDYSTLTAMRAPRPTLLIYNAEDDCCFRAPLVKPYVFDAIKPFFRLYGKEDVFQFHQNTNVSAHNYGLDDREQAYRFFDKYFNLQGGEAEIPVGRNIKTYDELKAGIPKDNLTILGLARKMAQALTRPPVPASLAERDEWSTSQRAKLHHVVRYHPVRVSHAWEEDNTDHNQVESVSYRFEMNNGLAASGVWLKEVPSRPNAPMTIVLNDGGKRAAARQLWDRIPEVADRMERGEQVLAVDLLFTGDAAPDQHAEVITEMLAATGERPLGMEAAQLVSIAQWAQSKWAPVTIRVETTGIRSQVISLVAAALEPHLFSDVENYRGMHSLSYLLNKPVNYEAAPDLFCLDLYKDFDLDQLEALASPARVVELKDAGLSSAK